MTDNISISFDENNRLRLLDANEFQETRDISNQCNILVNHITNFQKQVDTVVDVLTTQAEKIENNKMLAIGQRNRVETETEMRRRKQAELQYLISQKQIELNRYIQYHNSLKKMETSQKQIIDRLQIN